MSAYEMDFKVLGRLTSKVRHVEIEEHLNIIRPDLTITNKFIDDLISGDCEDKYLELSGCIQEYAYNLSRTKLEELLSEYDVDLEI